jgi:putative ABC transport system permease protein
MNSAIQAVRALLRSPGYSIAAVLTLALGIGISTAMFGIIQASLLRPLPYDAAEQLIRVQDRRIEGSGTGSLSTANYLDLQRDAQSVELAALDNVSFNLATGDLPERVPGLRVTANFFSTLGMQPRMGRAFVEGEDRDGRADIVVISHRVWQDRFGGRPDVLGETLLLDARPHDIVGVMPADFWFPQDPQLIVPFAWTEQAMQSRGERRYNGLGRMAAGMTPEMAHTELNHHFSRLAEDFAWANEGWRVDVTPFRVWALDANRASLLLVTGAVLLVLLIGSVNVANLMLVRAERHARETAVRVALGAGRGRIARQFVGEGLLLAASGALLGLFFAWSATRVLLAFYGGSLPRAEEFALSLPVLGFAAALAILVGALVGCVPVLRAGGHDVHTLLRQGARGLSGRTSRLQRALVVAQVAVAVLVVTGAGLLLNSFARMNAVDTGLDLDNALVFNLQLPTATYGTREATDQLFAQLLERIEALPQVASAGITDLPPMQGGMNITTMASPDDPDITASWVEVRQTTPGFFAAAGIPLLEGRGIERVDIEQQRNVVVISDELARTLFPGGPALGRRILSDWNEGAGFEIVGVVGSVREFGVTSSKRPAIYWPYQALFGRANNMVVTVRTHDAPMAAVPHIRQILATLDPTLPIYNVRTLREVMVETTGARRLATNLFTAFGALALALAAFGIFGMLAYLVEQRTREIGIRVALGAHAGRVRAMIVGQGLRIVALGLVIGLGAAFYLSQLLAELLFEVDPVDPLTFALVGVTALGAATAASYLPARRATRIEPIVAMRAE